MATPSPPAPQQRPAEYAGITGSLALLLAHALGVNDADTVTAIAAVLLWLPAAVTWIVTLLRKP